MASALVMSVLASSVSAVGQLPGAQEAVPTHAVVDVLGGDATAVAARGSVTFAAIGGRLEVFDETGQQLAALVGLAAPVNQLALNPDGTRLYAADDQGVALVDVSVATSPRLLSRYVPSLGGGASGVALAGQYAYVFVESVFGYPLDVVKVVDDRLEWRRRSAAAGSRAVVVGQTMYVVAEPIVRVVSIADPEAPVELKQFRLSGVGSGVDVWGDKLLIATAAGVDVVDVATPAEAQIVGTVPIASAVGVRVVGSQAYVISRSGDLSVVDLAGPTAPSVSTTLTFRLDARDLGIVGPDVAVVAAGRDGLVAIHTSGNRTADNWARAGGRAQDLDTDADLIYVAAGDSGLGVLRIDDRGELSQLAQLDVPGTASKVAVDGSLVLVGKSDGHLTLVDASQPDEPRILGDLTVPGINPDGLRDLVTASGVAYLTAEPTGLGVVTYDKQGGLRLVETIARNSFADHHAYSVAVDGGLLYSMWWTLAGQWRLVVYERSADGRLAEAGAVVIGDLVDFFPSALGVIGTEVFAPVAGTVAAEAAAVRPQPQGALSVGQRPARLQFAPPPMDNVLVVVDVSQVSRPSVEGALYYGGWASDMAARGRTAYIASNAGSFWRENRLLVIEVDEPVSDDNPERVDLPGLAFAVRLVGDYAVVAADEAGVVAVRVGGTEPAATPTGALAPTATATPGDGERSVTVIPIAAR